MKQLKIKISRIVAVLLLATLMISISCISAFATQPPTFDDSTVQTNSLLLIDTSNGEVLYSKNSDKVVPMASTVKILTCILAIENIENPETTMIEITESPINDILNQGASTAGFEDHIGESFSALDIIYGLMLPSGCDAAQILAYYIGTTPENFADMMNEKASQLGCENSYFVESHGLSDENYTTAEDMIKITSYALSLPYFREIVSSEYYTVDGYSYPYINTNYLIDRENGSEYYYQYATGIKTGYTDASGRCLVSTAQKGEKEYMCIALGGSYSSTDGDINHAMTDSIALYKWAFENFTDNIEVRISNSYASVEIGKQIAIDADVSEDTTLKWTSSDESVATVDENGVVTAISMGQAIISAISPSGNMDTVAVSCGFYNGIDVTSRYGDYSSGDKKDINWQAVKENGFDFSVIRAGWGSEDYPNQNDAQFVTNVKGAHENNIPFLLSFIAYAQSESEAIAEAEYFLREMKDFFPSDCENSLLSVVYNMTYSPYSSNDSALNTDIAIAFADKLREHGYNTIIFANKSVFNQIDTQTLTENSIGTYYSYYPYSADFSQNIAMPNGFVPLMWQYRSDGYFPHASEDCNTKQSIIYMMSTFKNTMSKPVFSAKLNNNTDVMLNWSNNDIPAYSYSIYELSDSDEKTLIKELDGNINEYTVVNAKAGTHRYIVEKTLCDIITQEKTTVTSNTVTIDAYKLFDVNHDTKEDIIDATYIQKVLANIFTAEENFKVYGDVNKDGDANIMDATYIQYHLANLL